MTDDKIQRVSIIAEQILELCDEQEASVLDKTERVGEQQNPLPTLFSISSFSQMPPQWSCPAPSHKPSASL